MSKHTQERLPLFYLDLIAIGGKIRRILSNLKQGIVRFKFEGKDDLKRKQTDQNSITHCLYIKYE